ncbi:MAG: MFS transporter [Anaerolineae bacterium]|nr:MFS transporter [Anaerolineae bacterium]
MTSPSTAAGNMPVEATPGYAHRWRAMISISIALIVISLDNTILNVALPSISRQLGATASELQWVVDAYVLVFASLLLTMGSLGDKLGRKRALQGGLTLFGIGSLWCALAPTTTALILARAFTGIGGALIMPATLSIISATFPPRERPRAIAIWAATFGLGVGIGPITGGILLRFFEWNSVFFVNLPIVVIALIGGQLYITDSRDEHAPPLDVAGVVLSIAGLFALLFAIIEAGELGWSAQTVWLAFGVAIVLLALFAWWENRTEHPMLPLSFFRNPSFTVANVSLVLVTFCLFGWTFFLTQYFQSVLGYTPFAAGLAALPIALMLTFVAERSSMVAERIGTNRTVALGSALAAVGMIYWRLTMTADTPYLVFMLGQLVFGLGLGLIFSPATNSVMQAVPVHRAGIGSAMNDMTRQLGGALGIAVLGSVANSMYRGEIEPLLASAGSLPEAVREAALHGIQGAHVIAGQLGGGLGDTLISTSNHAFLAGIYSAQIVAIVVLIAVSILAMRYLPAEARRGE